MLQVLRPMSQIFEWRFRFFLFEFFVERLEFDAVKRGIFNRQNQIGVAITLTLTIFTVCWSNRFEFCGQFNRITWRSVLLIFSDVFFSSLALFCLSYFSPLTYVASFNANRNEIKWNSRQNGHQPIRFKTIWEKKKRKKASINHFHVWPSTRSH